MEANIQHLNSILEVRQCSVKCSVVAKQRNNRINKSDTTDAVIKIIIKSYKLSIIG